ncbi:SIMPL domain-containing protein [Halomicrobium urmianum]|uniref:SIMPL domain-containing protein n=1 Tax=Halomicrobium urmianum TaxID=1586233 RepID=UPI001CDA1A02|nr:SIMPL domain-containing protein [Halomicrobium urmianum]
MQRRELLAATAGAAAAAVSGCLGMDGGSAAAQTGTPTVERHTSRSIVVSNTGEARGDPDLAVLNVAVEASGDAASDVRDELATRADELRQALLDFGLEEDAVTTEDFYIRERHDRRAMEEEGVRPGSEEAEEYVTYQGTHAFRAEVSTIDDVGAVIDAAVDGGADRVGRVTFTLSDEKRATLREEAIRAAIQGARAEAETVADEIGASIDEATVVDTAGGGVTPVQREVSYAADAAATATEAASTGVEPGEVTVTASVEVRYAIE